MNNFNENKSSTINIFKNVDYVIFKSKKIIFKNNRKPRFNKKIKEIYYKQ